MPSPTAGQIDEMMERASRALAALDYFQAEEIASRALHQARRISDFERMARICLPLQEARRQRVLRALDAGPRIRVIDELPPEEAKIEPGCYLIKPMLVAADGRKLRERAFMQRIPVMVLTCEPLTQSGLLPIATIGAIVIRTKVRPPRNLESPGQAWYIEAVEALGDAAIDEIDPALQGERLVDAVLERLESLPEHEKLHQKLEDVCRAAAHAKAAATRSNGKPAGEPQQVGSG